MTGGPDGLEERTARHEEWMDEQQCDEDRAQQRADEERDE